METHDDIARRLDGARDLYLFSHSLDRVDTIRPELRDRVDELLRARANPR